VILIDANILMYAANRAAPEHDLTRHWLDEQLSHRGRVGLPWPSLLAFVRLSTNALVVRQPASMQKAWDQVNQWLDAGPAWIPVPTDRHADVLKVFLRESWMTSRLVPDAHLAALAIEHGLTLCSTDGDFAKFPGLVWRNPLAAA